MNFQLENPDPLYAATPVVAYDTRVPGLGTITLTAWRGNLNPEHDYRPLEGGANALCRGEHWDALCFRVRGHEGQHYDPYLCHAWDPQV